MREKLATILATSEEGELAVAEVMEDPELMDLEVLLIEPELAVAVLL